jgi:hypothetical protein
LDHTLQLEKTKDFFAGYKHQENSYNINTIKSTGLAAVTDFGFEPQKRIIGRKRLLRTCTPCNLDVFNYI